MFIRELARITGIPAKTIRYYESIGLLPDPDRAANNYRRYTPAAIERLRYITAARSLGFSLSDIGEFLSARDEGNLPCRHVLDSVDARIAEIDQRIAELVALREALSSFSNAGASLPAGKKCDERCTEYMAGQVEGHGLTPHR